MDTYLKISRDSELMKDLIEYDKHYEMFFDEIFKFIKEKELVEPCEQLGAMHEIRLHITVGDVKPEFHSQMLKGKKAFRSDSPIQKEWEALLKEKGIERHHFPFCNSRGIYGANAGSTCYFITDTHVFQHINCRGSVKFHAEYEEIKASEFHLEKEKIEGEANE